MQYRQLGTTEIQTSVVGFGAWAIGGWMWGGSDEKEAIRAIDAAVDHGINLIDTAPMYGYGRSEEIVGKAIAGKRDKIVLATKCGLRWDTKDWQKGEGVLHFYGNNKGIAADGKFRVYKYLRPESIRWEIERSLLRMKTDHIDLLQTHWQEETTPIVATMETLLRLKEEGKIRAIGVSNVTVEHLRQYQAVGQVDVAQECFSLIDRQIEHNGILDFCKANGVSLLAYSPMANGLLTGRLSPDRVFNEGDLRRENPRFSPENINRVNSMLREFSDVAEKYHATLGQIVIAWTTGQYEKTHVLCGARSEKQVIENAPAGDMVLTEENLQTISDIAAEAGII
ncbi:MAG: aldo/keto reductase [Planctomycetaceae bacterium]|jgi:aryl-alcohol dehydrogenase-like predicted oxidoreductase|nr:aldo/keto reductase [Planctomycetaceae bacterium]